MLVAPTEPSALRAVGRTSSVPERFGTDVFWATNGRRCGVQRKEIGDLLASVADGRLQRELPEMARLDVAVLIVEGTLRWTLDGELMGEGWGRPWTKAQVLGLLWSVRAQGVWVERTRDLAETVETVGLLREWTAKERHETLRKRPGPNAGSMWGNADSREYGIWMLQALPGIGVELATRIWDHFGRVPWRWDVGVEELVQVEGVGVKTAEAVLAALGGEGAQGTVKGDEPGQYPGRGRRGVRKVLDGRRVG